MIKEALKTAGEKWKIFKLPVFRGVGVLGQALVLGIKALRFSAEEAIQDAEASEEEEQQWPPERSESRREAGEVVVLAHRGKSCSRTRRQYRAVYRTAAFPDEFPAEPAGI